jgi:TetR/AcrR family transcriptional regulator, cholesterol catabolism regulator
MASRTNKNNNGMDGEKEKIVISAARLIVKKGFLKTSVRDIAEYCGISMGKLYYYLKSKNDILTLFLGYSTSTSDASNKLMMKKLKKKKAVQALKEMMIQAIHYLDETQDVQVFWSQEARNLNKRNLRRLLKTNSMATLIFQNILEKGNEEGVFDVKEPAMVAQNIQMICEMWATRRWYLQKLYTRDEYIEMQIDNVLRMVTARK